MLIIEIIHEMDLPIPETNTFGPASNLGMFRGWIN